MAKPEEVQGLQAPRGNFLDLGCDPGYDTSRYRIPFHSSICDDNVGGKSLIQRAEACTDTCKKIHDH